MVVARIEKENFLYEKLLFISQSKADFLKYTPIFTMIFEITPDQITKLDQQQLVSLLQKLIQAELAKHNIPLRSGTAPAQLNIPDGGDDGRVSWTGGPAETDWLPNRFVIFQCKKGDPGPAGLTAETWTKSSKKTDSPPQISEAMLETLNHRGAYVIVTAAPVVGTKVDRRVEAIRDGITAAEHDPSLLSAIHIYDCNKLAAWVNTHPSLALWLNSLLRDVHLEGFQTHGDWGKVAGISRLQFLESETPRFVPEGREIQQRASKDSSVSGPKSFAEVCHLIGEFFGTEGTSARIIGPSGYGKTRFVHHLVCAENFLSVKILNESQVIYCVYEDVRDRLANIAREIVDSGSPMLLIVDDCPNTIHGRLHDIFSRSGSRSHLITVGVKTKTKSLVKSITVRLAPAGDDLIEGIASSINEQVSQKNASFVRELSEGFPQMAVLAAEALDQQDEELSSVDTLIDRIVWGANQQDEKAFEALKTLSLFSVVGMENEAKVELEKLAEFDEESYRNTYQCLKQFEERGVVLRQGDYAIVQPIPLAMRLAKDWIENNPDGTLESLFETLSDHMKLKMLSRLRWLSWSDRVRSFAVALLKDALLDNKALNSELGSKILDRLVHLAPDASMLHLETFLGNQSVEDLLQFEDGRRNVVWALERLAFRQQTFIPAARLLLRLGAAENEKWANNASAQFIGLYQLYLSGTEATPKDKLTVLDEGLSNSDQRIQKICIDALGNMLKTGHYSRSGGAEQIGAAAPLQDWRPKIYGEVYDYYRSALNRLENVAINNNFYTEQALHHIYVHLRSLFSIQPLFEELECLIKRLQQQYPQWYGSLKGLNSWLFYDATKADEAYRTKLRTLYDELLPNDSIELLLFYSAAGSIDIHDPDKPYVEYQSGDHEYSARKIKELVQQSSKSASDYSHILDKFSSDRYSSSCETVRFLAQHVDDPETLMDLLLGKVSSEVDRAILVQLARSVILGAYQKCKEKGLECLHKALSLGELKPEAINLIATVKPDDDLVRQAIELIRSDVVSPFQAVAIAWDDYLKDITPSLVKEVLSVILTKEGEGAWAAIRFISRWLYSSQPEEAWIPETIFEAATNTALFEKSQYLSTDWYTWNEVVNKLMDRNRITDESRLQLLNFVMSAVDLPEFHTQLSFENHAQKVLIRLVDECPKVVWEKYHEKNAIADINEKFRLEALFDADFRNSAGGGVLNEISSEIYIPWMLEDKQNRIKFIISWMRLFDSKENRLTWSSKFIEFIDAHVDDADQLDHLSSRLTSGSWIGDYSDLLETRREQLGALHETSNNSHVKQWINKTMAYMEQDIANQRRRDANFKAGHMA